MDVELHDWEVLDESLPLPTTYLEGIEGDSDGVIRPDYFSLDYPTTHHLHDVTDQASVHSDNPSWIDPSDYSKTKPIGDLWSTDGSESEASTNESKHDDEPLARHEGNGKERNRVAVLWKLPLDLLKYCLFRATPVWTLSVAAAIMGVVILGRRLYKIKHKTRILHLNIAIDDKKVSQVMSRAARLNEAFSVVKRAPIIRPTLPATGIAPWPLMALR